MKVLIVDDEPMARINLRCLIDWESEGCIICGEADSGSDALEKVEKMEPDLIFTDMNMGGMSGIDFIRQVKEKLPDVRIVAFSAFDDFEFVRQSMKEGALDYLIKHRMDASGILSTLHAIKENLAKESVERQKMNRIMAMASSGKVFVKRNVLMNLLNGYVQEDFESIMKEYEICLDGKNLMVVMARIDNYYKLEEKLSPQELALFLETMENILSNLCAEMGKAEYIYLDEGKYVFLMSFAGHTSEAYIHSKSAENIHNIDHTVKRFLNISMSFGVSTLCPSFGKLRDYFVEAGTALESGYYKGSSYIVRKSELSGESTCASCHGLSALDEKNLISHIRGLKTDNAMELIDEIFDHIRSSKVPYSAMKIISIEMINIIERMMKEFGIPAELVHPGNDNLYEDITKFRTLDEISAWIKKLYKQLLAVLERNYLNEGRSPIVKKAIEFIFKNYHRDISLSDVSKYVEVSPQYLSKLFKDECGKGFVAYLNSVRIEQAKRLLSEGVKLKDLADKTGFNNYTYFFTVFKEITGMTPQQYEKTT